ncbi:tetratricopeptide repeat protein [Carboxylicivirga linearis]|uniref:Tetratricopeptide repeat protein n=1 Tax=Carboxylicivirga linearis TaxID=1628157 RepID=A0ABS5JS72_9BACT|nr:tetratricopeptide repeat protein [Carboxylicivirga linearis]MBS2097735.1 tetratricopeptide repeat protein [Carboxylicivirga linearis]
MKRYILSILLFIPLALSAQDGRFEKANNHYINGEFEEAISSYNEILQTGMESGNLYYNLGNAYYKNGELANAILNYERALLLKPHDKDIQYNLELAYSQTADKIEDVGEIFITKWITSFRNKATSDFWAYVGIGCFILTLIGAAFFIYSRSVVLKKIGFYFGIIFLIHVIVTLSFAYKQRDKLINRDHAIVFSPTVTVKSSPDESGTEIFILHEGTKIKILSTLGSWKEIEMGNGNIGWIKEEAITII